jgi:hypothetical protein
MGGTTWSKNEESLLQEIYPVGSKNEIIEKFPQRSWVSISQTARRLHLKRNFEALSKELSIASKSFNIGIIWTTTDDEQLKKHYPASPKSLLLKALPDKSYKQIRERARKLGIIRDKNLIQSERMNQLKENLLEKYGVEYTTQLDSMKQSTQKTNMARRGVAFPSQSPEVQQKIKQAVFEKYGVENVFQAPEIKQKIIQTNLDKYGVENPSQRTTPPHRTF